MSMIHLSVVPDQLRSMAKTIFGYTGKLYKVVTSEHVRMNSHWEGGSRDFYAVINPQSYRIASQSGTPYDHEPEQVCLNENTAVLCHSIIMGKDRGITLYVHPSFAPLYLEGPKPGPEGNITTNEKIVLIATRSYKSSYAGMSNYRFVEAKRQTGIRREAWELAKQSCIDKQLLNKAGAITPQGKNIVEWADLNGLKAEVTLSGEPTPKE